MRALPIALLFASAFFLAGCTDDDDGRHEVQPTELKEIAMHNQMYEPSSVTVAKGATLRFEAHDTMHSAKSTDGTYDAGDIAQGTEKDVTMSTPGTFTFKCRFHAAMQLTATVTA